MSILFCPCQVLGLVLPVEGLVVAKAGGARVGRAVVKAATAAVLVAYSFWLLYKLQENIPDNSSPLVTEALVVGGGGAQREVALGGLEAGLEDVDARAGGGGRGRAGGEEGSSGKGGGLHCGG